MVIYFLAQFKGASHVIPIRFDWFVAYRHTYYHLRTGYFLGGFG